MILLIGGHPRSGTTLLQRLCDGHPDIAITGEFRNFLALNKSFACYAQKIIERWMVLGKDRVLTSAHAQKKNKPLFNFLFVMRYLSELNRHSSGAVDIHAVEETLKRLFPKARIVGDKYPDYILGIDKYSKANGLRFLAIHRDGRDVVSSALQMARTNWKDRAFVHNYDTADKVARRWVSVIDLTDRYRDSIFCVRYEDLVRNTGQVLKRLGAWLDIDPAGFPRKIIKDTSIGKHRSGLSAEELNSVIKIAGPALKRMGYLESD